MIRSRNLGVSAAVDDVRLPFTMNATVTYGDPPSRDPLPDPLPPGWVRIPISFQVMLPEEIMQQAWCGGSSSASAGTAGAPASIAPHSLRLDTGPRRDGDRTWQAFAHIPGTSAYIAIETPTTHGRIHYNKFGIHIVPAPPQPPETRDQV